MVTGLALAFMILEGLIPLALLVGLFVYAYRSGNLALQAVGVGVLIYFVFTQILEKMLHIAVLGLNPGQSGLLRHPLLYAGYGALAAALFEECGRWLGFSWLLKQRRQWRIGFSYGLGHGGLEAVLIGMGAVQNLMFASLINSGKFEATLGKQISAGTLAQMKASFLGTPVYSYLLGGLERIPAMGIQIALSLLVLQAVRTRRLGLLAGAIVGHFAADFGAGLYQAGSLPLGVTEVWVWIFGAAALGLILRSRGWTSQAAGSPAEVERN